MFKKNALIENRLKDTKYEAKFNWKSHFSSKWPLIWHWKYISIVAWVFLGWFMGVFRLFHGFSRVLQDYFKSVSMWYVTGVPRVFLGCFCPIEISWVAAMTSIHTLEAQCGYIWIFLETLEAPATDKLMLSLDWPPCFATKYSLIHLLGSEYHWLVCFLMTIYLINTVIPLQLLVYNCLNYQPV